MGDTSNIDSFHLPNNYCSKVYDVIHCIQRGDKLTKVDLSNCSLKEIPIEIYELKDSLEFLNLSYNDFSDLSPDITKLSKLKILFFQCNKFSKIPIVLGQLPSLYMLSFKSNTLETLDIESLSPSIGWLILTDNKISQLPDDLGYKLPLLKKVMLAGNRLKTLPQSLSNANELELLRLSGNEFEKFPLWLFALPKLSWLALAGNPIFSSTKDKVVPNSTIQYVNWMDLDIKEQLGEGASGTVYRAVLKNDINGVTDVALKIFKGQATSDGFPEDEMYAAESVGNHKNSIQVLGKITHHPENKLGLLLCLISSDYYTLGGPPSFESVTRDVYKSEQQYSLQFILNILSGISSFAYHLHANNVSHGDLYAHNTLIHKDTGFPLLGDFGAATCYDSLLGNIVNDMTGNMKISEDDIYKLVESLEVRAFGCLIEEMLSLLMKDETFNLDVISSFRILQERCFNENILQRPSFQEIVNSIENIKKAI